LLRFSVVRGTAEGTRRAVVSGYRWHAASAEIAGLVRTAGPWVAYVSAVVVAVTALAIVVRTFAVLPA
jgi:hypothetical protein